MNKALIVIDMQNDYFETGKMPLVNINNTLDNCNELISYAKKNDIKIFFIKHISLKEEVGFFIANTKGVNLHDSFNLKDGIIVEKNYPNSFRKTILKNELEKYNISDLIVCGAMTHMCVDTTVRAAFDLDFTVTLAHDACATRDLVFEKNLVKAKEVQSSYLAALGSVFCEVKATKDIV